VLFHKVRIFIHGNLLISFDDGIGHRLFFTYFFARVFYVLLTLKTTLVEHIPRQKIFWAFFLGNVGLAIRSYRFAFVESLFLRTMETLELQGLGLEVTWLTFGLYFVCTLVWTVICVRLPAANKADDYLYYKLHRTLHVVPHLWNFCHGLHHKALTPSCLDSGTIGPPELIITETGGASIAAVDWPYPVLYVWEFVHMIQHYLGHNSDRYAGVGLHHLLHHKFSNCNYGIHAELDILNGTYRMEHVELEKTKN
jgi:sterol desaturase/sphingolipid hydroxylase (fatty acid hydroxylase superfamily)